MKFEEALKCMRYGVKIRRKGWGKYCYIMIDGSDIVNQNFNPINLSSSILAEDWEVVENA